MAIVYPFSTREWHLFGTEQVPADERTSEPGWDAIRVAYSSTRLLVRSSLPSTVINSRLSAGLPIALALACMMPREAPPLPPHAAARFTASVHGTVFCDRARHLSRVHAGDELLLIPGPPIDDPPGIWVHLHGGDLIGHLPPEIESWLAPWMLRGGRATARVLKVENEDVPSWRRLLIEVQCG